MRSLALELAAFTDLGIVVYWTLVFAGSFKVTELVPGYRNWFMSFPLADGWIAVVSLLAFIFLIQNMDALIEPQSGILFWSALTSLGIVGLFFAQVRALRLLGWASLILLALIAVRVPLMYFCIGQGTELVSGLNITCPPDSAAIIELIRFDSNRYIIPLVPFSVLGLRGSLEKLITLLGNHFVLREQTN